MHFQEYMLQVANLRSGGLYPNVAVDALDNQAEEVRQEALEVFGGALDLGVLSLVEQGNELHEVVDVDEFLRPGL